MNRSDIVKSKASKRPMIVVAIDGTRINCAWYEGCKRVVGEFHVDNLEPVLPEDLLKLINCA